MEDIRWKQRFENLQASYQLLQEAIATHKEMPENHLIEMALIKSFEMTFELAWKTMKDYLVFNGIDVKLPREIIKQAFATDIIVDGQLWIDMLEERNLMAHVYDHARALQATERICGHFQLGLAQLHQYLLDRLN
jgi:nucleotidyltransferase substrate binding protein (TIGR01987 family)